MGTHIPAEDGSARAASEGEPEYLEHGEKLVQMWGKTINKTQGEYCGNPFK